MAHSVEAHLALSPEEYDAGIRRFVPFYEEMLSCAVDWLARLAPPDARILDLGAGTGSLAQRTLARMPAARLTLLDVDAAMLAQARARLGPGPALVCGSFFDPLPPCDFAIASLSLHHVRGLDEKRALYANIRRALPPGGALLDVDVALPASAPVLKAMEADWAVHLMAHGDTEAEARARFAAWAAEDTYLALEDELSALRAAGFSSAEVLWRRPPAAVLLALA